MSDFFESEAEVSEDEGVEAASSDEEEEEGEENQENVDDLINDEEEEDPEKSDDEDYDSDDVRGKKRPHSYGQTSTGSYKMSEKGTDKDPICMRKLGNEQYSSHLSSGLNQLRKESSFCDVTIIVGDQRFPAHKAVLSCASHYFQGMFSAGFQESAMSEVTVPGTEECFAQLLEFAYTGYFSLSLKTAPGILRMACYMVLQDAMKLCAEYLEDVKANLSVDDCFEVWSIATNHDILQDLAKASKDDLVGNFPECGRSEVFLENASADVLLEMLTDDYIETDTCGEEQIVEVVKAWLKHDWEHRQIHAVDLLKKIRLGLLPVDTLQEVLGDEILKMPECKAMVEEVIKLNATKEDADVPLIESHPDLFASRNTVTGQLAWSRYEGFICKTTSGCYGLDRLMNDCPIKYPYLDIHFSDSHFCGFVVVDGTEIYIARGFLDGGSIEDEDEDEDEDVIKMHNTLLKDIKMHNTLLKENNFCKFDLNSNEWTVLKPMEIIVEEYALYLHKLGDYICAVGCDERYDYFIQRYSLITKEWEDCVAFKSISSDHAVVEQCILWTCERDNGDDAYILYNPKSKKIREVHNNNEDTDLGVSDMKLEVDEAGTCYLRDDRQFYKVISDFSGDIPSVTLQSPVERETSHWYWNRKDSHRPVLTFDKRKLKMSEEAVECDCH